LGGTTPKLGQQLRSISKNTGIASDNRPFSKGLLKKTREGSIYIASNDHGDGRGYFLIQDGEDAEVMQRWYLRRIQVEREHLAQLDQLITQHFG
jgi:hypothetical protein